MEAMLTIVSKVAVMLIMIVVGYYIAKKGVFTERGTSEINTLLLQIVTPCLIINSFNTTEDDKQPMELLMALGTTPLAIFVSLRLSNGY